MRWLVLLSMTLNLAGCAQPAETPEAVLTIDELMDPQTCRGCHPGAFDEWASSMHAYASQDPVFLAMNARGQRETGGALGDFCVQCHAPMALELGLTTDGLNLPELPSHVQGVTCYFCHSVTAIEGSHNNPLKLVHDGVMRGGIKDPVANIGHASGYSALLDRDSHESGAFCGSCHDIVTQSGVHLERTFTEWKGSVYGHEDAADPATCATCHMPGKTAPAAVGDDLPLRRIHDHRMAGIDQALTPFPGMDAQAEAIQTLLDPSVRGEICVVGDDTQTTVTVTLENLSSGHHWPSGAAADRRAWVELVGYDEDDTILFSSGLIADDSPVAHSDDPQLWQLRDYTYDADGEEAHFFWEVASIVPATLPAPTTLDFFSDDYEDTHRVRSYTFSSSRPAKVTMRLRIRAVGLEILDSLVNSGDLAPEVRNAMTTLNVGFASRTWIRDEGQACVPQD